MAFFYVTPSTRRVYRPPHRWTWGSEYDPFDLFSEFIGHHPSTLMGYPALPYSATIAAGEQHEERKWHKVVKLAACFGPDDFKVTTQGNALTILAVHEETDELGDVDRCEVTRRVEVPDQVDMDTVRTLWLKRGGILVVGHLKKPPGAEQPAKKAEKAEDQEAQKEGEAAGAKSPIKRQLSIDPENFSNQMRSFAQDVHEALFGAESGGQEPQPEAVIPMDYETAATKEAKKQDDDSQDITLDITGYEPEEVKVSVNDGVVNVQAKHAQEDEEHSAVYQFRRCFTLPEGAVVPKISSRVNKDKDTLVISVPIEKKAIEFKPEEK